MGCCIIKTGRSYGAQKEIKLLLYKQLTPTGQKRTTRKDYYFKIKQRIEHREELIIQLVYELYELTPEKIKNVKGGESG